MALFTNLFHEGFLIEFNVLIDYFTDNIYFKIKL